MKSNPLKAFAIATVILVFASCEDQVNRTLLHYSDEDYAVLTERLNLPSELYEYGLDRDMFINLGFGGGGPGNSFITGNETKNHMATLGRVLFYDEQLSVNNTVSCASCHEQSLAFADDDSHSLGFEGGLSLRNSLPLGNTVGFEVAYGGGSINGDRARFGWDEANHDVATQTEAAITSTIEMGMHDMRQLTEKLQPIDYYQVLFRKAFGNQQIKSEALLIALDEFVNSISSNRSEFDKAAMLTEVDGPLAAFEPFDEFTNAQNNGKDIYNAKCGSCHSMDHTLTAIATANNGLELNYQDQGVGGHTNLQQDMGVFKVPFLRNVGLTAPYMHDGRFETLEEVVDFYSTGIKLRFNFTEQEKSDLIAYLHTLTDHELLTEAKWSDPFKR